jgi:hypothetical protein
MATYLKKAIRKIEETEKQYQRNSQGLIESDSQPGGVRGPRTGSKVRQLDA